MPAIALTVFTGAYLSIFLLFLGCMKPNYSHIRHTISELGAPHQRLVAVGVFLPVGVIFLLIAFLVWPIMFESAALALCISTGYLIAAIFPCDAGSPLSGTTRQAIHNLGGAVEYVGGALALFRVATHFGQPFQAAGFIVLAAAIAISLPPLTRVRGLIQRIAECCLFSSLALSLWRSMGLA